MAQISLTRALSELSSLETRIAEAISGSVFVGTKISSSGRLMAPVNRGLKDEAELQQLIQSSKDRVDSLIARRSALRAAMAKANLETTITICGRVMSINEALDLKANVLPAKVALLGQLRTQLHSAEVAVNTNNTKLETRAQELYQATISGSNQATNNRTSDQDLLGSLLHSQRTQFGMELVDPLGLRVLIQTLTDEIEELNSQLDFCLSEINAITQIEVD